jgi:hypothetical protein
VPEAGPLDGMLSLSADQTSVAAGDQIVFTFRFENRYGTYGNKISESTFTSNPSVVLYGPDRVSQCALDGDTGVQLKPGLEISYTGVLMCSYPYRATSDDAAAGEIRAWVTLDAPGIGTTTSNEVVIPVSSP